MRLPRASLTGVIVAAALAELILDRAGGRLAPALLEGSPSLERGLALAGTFARQFAGFLALFALVWAVVVLLRDGRLFGPLARTALAAAAALFLPLAGAALVRPLPPPLGPHLHTTFALLALVLALGLLARRRASLRWRFGALLLAAPLVAHGAWVALERVPALALHPVLRGASDGLYVAGEHLAVVAAFGAFLFFTPHPRRRVFSDPVPLTVAMLATGGAMLLLQLEPRVALGLARDVFGLALPAVASQATVFYLLALFCFSLSLAWLAARPGAPRAAAAGLLLVALAGYRLEAPHQLLLSALGLGLVVRAALAGVASDAGPAPDWEGILRAASEGDVVTLESGDRRIVRLAGSRDGIPLSIRLVTRGPRAEELEVTVGRPPRERPPAAIQRVRGARARRGGRLPGPRLRAVHRDFAAAGDGDLLTDILADPALEGDLLAHLHGRLGLWPREGLRYRVLLPADGWPVAGADDPAGELRRLISLLLRLARRAGVSP